MINDERSMKLARHKQFLQMVTGATVNDCRFLLDFQYLRKQIYVYDHEIAGCHHPDADEIPWTLVWLLGRYNRKEVIPSRRVPDTQTLEENLANFVHRLKWKWHFRNNIDEERADEELKRKLWRSRSVKPMMKRTCPELDAWCHSFSNVVLKAQRDAILHDKWECRTTEATYAGMRTLAYSKWCAVITDKDGGFALVPKTVRPLLIQKIFQMKMYKEVNPPDKDEMDKLRNTYGSLCKKIAYFEKMPEIAKQMFRSFEEGNLFSEMGITVKTH